MKYLLLLMLLVPTVAQAATFFDTDFESGSTLSANGWFKDNPTTDPQPGVMEITTEQALSGSHALKLTYDNVHGSTFRPNISKGFGGGFDHVFERFAYRQACGFLVGDNTGSKRIRLNSNGGDGHPYVWVYLWGSVSGSDGKYGFDVEAPYASAATVTVGARIGTFDNITTKSTVQPSCTSWDQVEVEVLLNTPGSSNGLMRMWVNNILVIEALNIAFRGPTPSSTSQCCGVPSPSTGQYDSALVYLQSGLGSIYYDRLAIGNARIGTVGSPPVDTTPPAVPSGLQVQ